VTRIADWPDIIVAETLGTGEHYLTGEINLSRLRHQRKINRNAQQRRPDIYQEILMEIPKK